MADNIKKWIGKEIIHSKGFHYLILLLLYNCMVYYGTKLLSFQSLHHTMETIIDTKLPFVPFFVLFYLLAYVQWILVFFLVTREQWNFCKIYFTGEIFAKSICFVFFLVYPTTINRPDIIEPQTIWEFMVKLIYRLDSPVNLFPSIHCLESWFCFRVGLMLKKKSNLFHAINIIMTVLVFLSTVLIKQHYVLDILGGILVTEVGLMLSKRIFKFKKCSF